MNIDPDDLTPEQQQIIAQQGFLRPDQLTEAQKKKAAKEARDAVRIARAAAAWWALLIQPLVILVLWNVGVASIAHVTTFHAYWPLLAFSLDALWIKAALSR